MRAYQTLRINEMKPEFADFSSQYDALQAENEALKTNDQKVRLSLMHPLLNGQSAEIPKLPSDEYELLLKDLNERHVRKTGVQKKLQSLTQTSSWSNQHLTRELQVQLNAYINTGDLNHVIAWMQKHQPSAYRLDFKTNWHQMQLTLWDKKYPIGSSDVTGLNQRIHALASKGFQHALSLIDINQTIVEMELYAKKFPDDSCEKKLADLANVLKQDMVMLLDKKMTFPEFQNKFLARLHSQDVLMHDKNANEAWRYVVANLIIGLFTAGIALGIHYAYSHVSQGRGVLFFDQTEKERCINRIENALRAHPVISGVQ